MTRHIFRLGSRYTGYFFVAPWKVIRRGINSSGPGRHKSFTHNEHRAGAVGRKFRAEKRSAHVSAHLLSQAQGGLFWLYLFVTERILTETEKNARDVKPFYLFVFFFRHLKITFDSEQPMLKENGSFRQSEEEASIFLIVHSINLWVDFTFFRRAELKPACILLLVVTVTFIACPDLILLQNQIYPSLRSKNHIANVCEWIKLLV